MWERESIKCRGGEEGVRAKAAANARTCVCVLVAADWDTRDTEAGEFRLLWYRSF